MKNYYYIDFKALIIASNEGEGEYSEFDMANIAIGNSYHTYALALRALGEIVNNETES